MNRKPAPSLSARPALAIHRLFTRIAKLARIWFRTIREALVHFNESEGWALASHVTLSLMIAVFPFLIFTTSLAGFFGKGTLTNDIVDLVFDYWPDGIAEPITREIEVVLNQGNTGFLTLGGGLALWFASNGVEAVRLALNRAYRDTESQPFWKQRFQSLTFVILGAILMFVVSVLLVFVPIYLSFIEVASPTIYYRFLENQTLRLSAAVGVLVFAIFACHRWLPGRCRPMKQIWPGIVWTLVLWSVAASGFVWYLQRVANYSTTYAGLAVIMTALIFLYLMAVILLFGAEYNSAGEHPATINSHTPPIDRVEPCV